MSFRGTYDHSVDSKGRVSLPARFRKELDDEIVAVPVPDKNLGNAIYVFRDEDFDEWKMSFFRETVDANGEISGGFNPKSARDNDLARYLDALAEILTVDSVGRIKLSPKQLGVAGITRDVAIVGRDYYIEVWDAQTFEARMESINPFAGFMEE